MHDGVEELDYAGLLRRRFVEENEAVTHRAPGHEVPWSCHLRRRTRSDHTDIFGIVCKQCPNPRTIKLSLGPLSRYENRNDLWLDYNEIPGKVVLWARYLRPGDDYLLQYMPESWEQRMRRKLEAGDG